MIVNIKSSVLLALAFCASMASAQTVDWTNTAIGGPVAFTGSSVSTIVENHSSSPRTAILKQANTTTGALTFSYTNSATFPEDYTPSAICGDGSGNTYVSYNVFGAIGNSLVVQKYTNTQAAPLWTTTISSSTAHPFGITTTGGYVFVGSNIGSGVSESTQMTVFQASTGSQVTAGTQSWSASIGTSIWATSNATYTAAYIAGSDSGPTEFQLDYDIFTAATSSWTGGSTFHKQNMYASQAVCISGDSSAAYLGGWDIHIPTTAPIQEGLAMKFVLNSGGVPSWSTSALTTSATNTYIDSAIYDLAGTVYTGVTGSDHNRLLEYSSSLGLLNTWTDTLAGGEVVSGLGATSSRVRMFSCTPSSVTPFSAHLISTNTSCSLIWDFNATSYNVAYFSDGSSGESYLSGSELLRVH